MKANQIDNFINEVVDESMKHMGHNPFGRSDFVRATEQVISDELELKYSENEIPNIVDEVIGLLSDYLGDY